MQLRSARATWTNVPETYALLRMTSNHVLSSDARSTMSALRNFRPLLDRVLVQRLAPETKTKTGLLIPEKAQGKVNEATVVAIGPGGRDKDGKTVPMAVKVGDKVLVPEYGGTKLTFEEEDYHLFRDGDILGVFDS